MNCANTPAQYSRRQENDRFHQFQQSAHGNAHNPEWQQH